MPTDLRLAIIQPDEPLFDNQPLFRSCVFHEDHNRDNLAVYDDHVWCFACNTRMWATEFAAKYLPNGVAELSFTKTLERHVRYGHKEAKRSLAHLESLAASSEVLLWRTPHAVAYLTERGIDGQTARLYRLGHTGFAYVLPILDAAGNVVSLRFRRDDTRDPDGKHKYWGERGYNQLQLYPHALQGDPHTVVLTEGEFDALLLRAQGILAYSLTNGSGGAAHPEEVEQLLTGVQHLVFVGDQDKQGKKNTTTLSAGLISRMKDATALIWDGELGKDITALWQQNRQEFDRQMWTLYEVLGRIDDAERSTLSLAH